MPFWVAKQQVQQIPYWSRWANLFPTRKWEQNKGDVALGYIDEFSPLNRQVHKPNRFTSNPLKTVTSTYQRTNLGYIYRHRFESPKFNFLPSFRDFARNGIAWATKDLNRQIALGNDLFIRNNAWNYSPNLWLAKADEPLLTTCPVGPPGEGNLADPKTAAFVKSAYAQVKGYLDFVEINAVRSAARNVLGLVPWDGVPDAPGDNSILSGKWLLMGEGSLYEALTFDPFVLGTRLLTQDLQHREWMGIIGGNILFRQEAFPLRFAADGTMPAPEIEQILPANGTITSGSSTVTNPGGAAANVQIIPNPDYVNAPIGVAWFMGHAPFETLEVGPPPSEFAGAKLDTARLGKLSWNGEVQLTQNVLEQYGGASGAAFENMDTNKYGELCQLIAQVASGFFPNTPRRCIPIMYQRNVYPSRSTQLTN